jgi:hypothetical protein
MKFKTFRNLTVLVGIVVAVGLSGTCVYLSRGGDSKIAESKSSPSNTNRATATTVPVTRDVSSQRAPTAVPATSTTHSNTELRREDEMIIEFLNTEPALTDKVKDAFPYESFKVNIYRDGNSKTWTRIKIDLNRDGKDDEKWDLAAGRPAKRRVSTNDDEQYDLEYRWRGGQWVAKN